MIKEGFLLLASSYILVYENSRNPYETKKRAIGDFIQEYTSVFIDDSFSERAAFLAKEIMESGVKTADAFHVACAILADCDCFLTTDDRLLRYSSDKIEIVSPRDFIIRTGGDGNGNRDK